MFTKPNDTTCAQCQKTMPYTVSVGKEQVCGPCHADVKNLPKWADVTAIAKTEER